jgi:transposase
MPLLTKREGRARHILLPRLQQRKHRRLFGTCLHAPEPSPPALLPRRLKNLPPRSVAPIALPEMSPFARFTSRHGLKPEIARRLKMSRQTVRRFLVAETFPERSRSPYRGSILDPYKPYILERWKSGCWNGTQLSHEVKMRGYSGSDSLFRLFISQLRKQHQSAGTASALALDASGAHVQIPADSKPVPTPKGRLSPTRASWLCVCQPDKLDEKQRKLVEQIRATHRDLDSAYQLSQAFVTMLAEHRDQDLDGWLIKAKQSGIRELKSFAEAYSSRLRGGARRFHFSPFVKGRSKRK